MPRSRQVLRGLPFVDPVSRPGWYVLARRETGGWYVLQSREQRQHIETAWVNSAGMMHERVLLRVFPNGDWSEVSRSTV